MRRKKGRREQLGLENLLKGKITFPTKSRKTTFITLRTASRLAITSTNQPLPNFLSITHCCWRAPCSTMPWLGTGCCGFICCFSFFLFFREWDKCLVKQASSWKVLFGTSGPTLSLMQENQRMATQLLCETLQEATAHSPGNCGKMQCPPRWLRISNRIRAQK